MIEQDAVVCPISDTRLTHKDASKDYVAISINDIKKLAEALSDE